MKRSIALISLLITVTGPTLAEKAEAQTPRISLASESDGPYVNACVSMFIARLFPGQPVSLHAESITHERQIFSSKKRYASQADQEITMVARLKQDNSRLAIGSCSVSRNGRVMSVSVRATSVLKLARLQPDDLQLSMISP